MSQELEKARKAAIMNRVIKYAICFGLPLFGFLFGIAEENFWVGVGAYLLFCFILSSLWAFLSKNKALAQYRSLFKKEMIELALNGGTIYENMEYQYDAGIDPQIVNRSGLLTTDRYFSDCYISATYQGVKFVQADIRNVHNSQNGSTLEYDGTFIAFPTTLPDATQTNIYHKDADISVVLPGKKYQTARQDFNGVFKVSSSDHDKAGSLLNDEFINRLLKLQSQTPRKIVMTVKQGWVYAFLPNRNSVLKPKLFAKYDDSMKQAILQELCLAQQFISAFH